MSINLGKMKRGDTKTVQFTVSGATLGASGLTGYTLWFTAKEDVSDADVAAIIERTGSPGPGFVLVTAGSGPTSPVDAVVTCDIVPADTSGLPDNDVVLTWDFQVESPSGRVTTAADGTLTVQADITRASV
jgi:hypothetical protein